MSTGVVIHFLATLTVLAHVFILVFILGVFVEWLTKKPLNLLNKLRALCSEWGIFLAFLVATVATLGSLYLSEIAHFVPCKLCWLQRIFMYPQVLLLGIAFYKRTKDVIKYVLPMSVIGAAIAKYHYLLQLGVIVAPCDASGVSCATKYTFEYGYITIPVMSLTAFVLIILVLLLVWSSQRNQKISEFR